MNVPLHAPLVTCPSCSADTVNVLDYSSSLSLVWYLRCIACGHVWTLPKREDNARPAVRQALSLDDVVLQREIRRDLGGSEQGD